MKIKRYAAASGTAVLLALSLSACGGGVDAPEDASQEAFCETFNSQAEIGEAESAGDQADKAHDIADKLEEVGTPDDISDDARKGFEEYVEALQDIDEDDVETLSDASEDEAAEALDIDQDAFTAFFEYAFEACAGAPPAE
jgi:hypothetical protein